MFCINANRTFTIACSILIAFILLGAGYKLGYSAKHPNQYIYIKGSEVNHNLFKVLDDCGIQTDKEQREAIFQRLKTKR